MALEKGRFWVKPILDSGAEISCGGHRYRDNFHVDPAEEDRLISQSIDTLQELTGDKSLPKGKSSHPRVVCFQGLSNLIRLACGTSIKPID